MDVLKLLGISLLSTSLLGGVIIFIIKRLVEKAISLNFNKQEKIMNHLLDKKFEIENEMFDNRKAIYPEIHKIISEILAIVKKAILQDLAYKWEGIQLSKLCGILTERLINYRFYISEETYKEIHDFKRISQDLLIKYEYLTREGKEMDTELYKELLPSIKKIYDEMTKLYNQIDNDLKQKYQNLGQGK